MTAKTEQQLENELIEQLTQNGYERVSIPNVAALNKNSRNEMNRLNKNNLQGTIKYPPVEEQEKISSFFSN